jgi:hypothetical protein
MRSEERIRKALLCLQFEGKHAIVTASSSSEKVSQVVTIPTRLPLCHRLLLINTHQLGICCSSLN